VRNAKSMTTTAAKRLAASALGESMMELGEIAELLGVEYRTVQKWRADGALPPADFSLGRVVRWKPATIAAFIRSRASDGSATGNAGGEP
jgi:predicted DNA-binding transcriptional regulator AlpA